MYKDKDKQREANKKAMRRNRTKSAAVLGDTLLNVIPETDIRVIPKPKRCSVLSVENVGKPKPERTALGNIRVSKPGDDDYVPMCETTRRFLTRTSPVLDERDVQAIVNGVQSAPSPTTPYPKRGKDIKTFADLPPDVQATINRISQSNEEKQKRTKAAIKYQHLFPDRFHSTGYAGTPNLGQAQTAEIGEVR